MHIIFYNYFQYSTQQITAGRKDSQNDHCKNCFSVNKHKKVKNRLGGGGGGGDLSCSGKRRRRMVSSPVLQLIVSFPTAEVCLYNQPLYNLYLYPLHQLFFIRC